MFQEKHILYRFYIVAGSLFLLAIFIYIKLCDIQISDGEKYRQLAETYTIKDFVIPANRGNIYADDESLLATSIPKYDIRFDAVTVSKQDFDENLEPLSEAMAKKFGKSKSHWKNLFVKARSDQNRYAPVIANLSYSDYLELKKFPMFSLGPFKGGIITEQRTVREHPIGKIAERTIGNDRDKNPVGFEAAFNDYLQGIDGKHLKQKIAKGQWKPIFGENEVEPQDGLDVVTTINVNIQDIAHHALLAQLEKHEADHGTVIVMETKTGEIKAVSNLGRTADGNYFEKLNYAIGESHEPGSTFKTMVLVALLEDQVIDTSTVINTGSGSWPFYGRTVSDARRGGYGEISVAKALEVSSNIAFARVVDEKYKNNPSQFINLLKKMQLDQAIGLPIKGEGMPIIPSPSDKKLWSKNALPSIAYGYNVSMTPLQVLTFYNAIANDGIMVKPRFLKEIKKRNTVIEQFETEIINPQIASEQTIRTVQEVLKNIVIRGTGKRLYSPDFSMAGKTGTARTEYWMDGWNQNRRYVSSFVGYFPAENPKYSCIVVIHKPSIKKGYYGADVTGPVFKSIAQKIYIESPEIDHIQDLEMLHADVQQNIELYQQKVTQSHTAVPNVQGMAGMDAVALLENLGLYVTLVGNGKVIRQSIPAGEKLSKGKIIVLELS
jgi:cell division protein FtsI (penicillin-binding protein 3)